MKKVRGKGDRGRGDSKGPLGNFWGDEHVHLNWGEHLMDIKMSKCIKLNLSISSMCGLLYINYTSRKLKRKVRKWGREREETPNSTKGRHVILGASESVLVPSCCPGASAGFSSTPYFH